MQIYKSVNQILGFRLENSQQSLPSIAHSIMVIVILNTVSIDRKKVKLFQVLYNFPCFVRCVRILVIAGEIVSFYTPNALPASQPTVSKH